MKWLMRILLKAFKAFVKKAVSEIIIEGTNFLVEGRFSSELSTRLNISEERVDAIIREFGERLVEYTEENLDRVLDSLIQTKKGADGV